MKPASHDGQRSYGLSEVRSEAGIALPNVRLTLSLSALANLLCASLTEDPYGVAQRDIPKILEAFVLYLDELDGLEKSLMAEAESSKLPERKAEFTKQIGEQVGSVQAGKLDMCFTFACKKLIRLPGIVIAVLREGIRQVVTDFEPYLSEFREYPMQRSEQLGADSLAFLVAGQCAGFPTHVASKLQLLIDWG